MGNLVADITMSLDGFITGIGGGANVIQQYLAAGLVDELRLHVAPVLLGAGKPLFDNLGDQAIELERTGVIESPCATHLFFTVRR